MQHILLHKQRSSDLLATLHAVKVVLRLRTIQVSDDCCCCWWWWWWWWRWWWWWLDSTYFSLWNLSEWTMSGRHCFSVHIWIWSSAQTDNSAPWIHRQTKMHCLCLLHKASLNINCESKIMPIYIRFIWPSQMIAEFQHFFIYGLNSKLTTKRTATLGSVILTKCRLSSSVTRVYCDKTVNACITRFSLKSSMMPRFLA